MKLCRGCLEEGKTLEPARKLWRCLSKHNTLLLYGTFPSE